MKCVQGHYVWFYNSCGVPANFIIYPPSSISFDLKEVPPWLLQRHILGKSLKKGCGSHLKVSCFWLFCEIEVWTLRRKWQSGSIDSAWQSFFTLAFVCFHSIDQKNALKCLEQCTTHVLLRHLIIFIYLSFPHLIIDSENIFKISFHITKPFLHIFSHFFCPLTNYFLKMCLCIGLTTRSYFITLPSAWCHGAGVLDLSASWRPCRYIRQLRVYG